MEKFLSKSGDGVHEKAIELLEKDLGDGKILIVGAGEGAFEAKLLSKGIDAKRISAIDIDPAQYKLDNVEIRYSDLNKEIPYDAETFDICIASEVIEHLHNPKRLVDETHRVLKPGGVLCITTPNVHSLTQKIRYLVSDTLAWFQEHDYQGSGHIHPMFLWLLERFYRDNFELIEYSSQSFHFRLVPGVPAIPMPFRSRLFAVNNILILKKRNTEERV